MIKQQLKQAVLSSGVLRLAGRLHGKGAAILMYHSVLEDPGSVADSLGGMIHPRPIFEGQMELLAREFHPVSLDQVGRFVSGEEELPERAVVVTFDDGYADNFEMAMPILDRLGVPAAFYVTVDCVESRRLPWPSRLRYSFRKTARKEWKGEAAKVWNLGSEREREAAYLAACDRVAMLAGAEQERVVSHIEFDLGTMLPAESGDLMMNWGQVRGLAGAGRVEAAHGSTYQREGRSFLLSLSRAFSELDRADHTGKSASGLRDGGDDQQRTGPQERQSAGSEARTSVEDGGWIALESGDRLCGKSCLRG